MAIRSMDAQLPQHPSSPTFGVLLRSFRAAADLTQEQLAERSGVSVRAISDLEREVKTRPQRATISLLADGLGLDPARRAELEAVVPSRNRTNSSLHHSLDLPVGGFLGAVPERPLIGRNTEIARIREVVHTVRGGAGQFLLFVGEAGAGKTRLAQETTIICRANGMYLAAGRCYEPQQSVAYYPFLEIVSRLIDPAQTLLGLDSLQRWPQLKSLLPVLPSERISNAQWASREGDQQRLFWAVAGIVEAISTVMPIVVAIDDLHWADQSSLDLLLHLAHQLRNAPVLLLGAYRDDEVGRRHPFRRVLRDLHREELTDEVSVRRLGIDETETLLRLLLDNQHISPALVNLVQDQTQGNAFFVQEVVRGLVERGDAFEQDGMWHGPAVDQIDIPRTVQEAVRDRLARLPAETREILQEASVLGDTFEFDDLLAMGSRAEAEVDDALMESVQMSVVQTGKDEQYSFNHVLIQRVLYHGIPRRRRKHLHVAAGDAIEQQPEPVRRARAAELAGHFVKGGVPIRSLPYAAIAGDQAARRYAHREAEQFYRLALDIAREHAPDSDVAAIEENLGMTLSVVSRYDEAIHYLESAAAKYRVNGHLDAEIRAISQIGPVQKYRRVPEQGIAQTRRVLDELETHEPPLDLSPLHLSLAVLYFGTGRYQEQLVESEAASRIALEFDNREVFVLAEERRSTAFAMLGEEDRSLEVALEMIPVAEELGEWVSLHRASVTLGNIYGSRGQFDAARDALERAKEAAERIGSPGRIDFAILELGELSYLQGYWSEADRLLERVQLGVQSSNSWFTPYPSIQLAELRLSQGRYREARRLLEAAPPVSINGDLQAIRFGQSQLARLDIIDQQPTRARQRLEGLLDQSEHEELQVTRILPILAEACAASGDLVEADRVTAESMRRATEQTAVTALLDTLVVRGGLRGTQGRWQDAERDYGEAVHKAREISYPYLEARALFEWGVMNQQRDDIEQARECLTAALAIFERLGAKPYVERTTEALATLQR